MSNQSFIKEEIDNIVVSMKKLNYLIVCKVDGSKMNIVNEEEHKKLIINKQINLVNNKLNFFVDIEDDGDGDSYETNISNITELIEFLKIELR